MSTQPVASFSVLVAGVVAVCVVALAVACKLLRKPRTANATKPETITELTENPATSSLEEPKLVSPELPAQEMKPLGTTTNLRPEDVTHSVTDIVGRGGSGIVYRGQLRLLDGRTEIVAIKRLHTGATQHEERRFVKEFAVSLRASQRCSCACKMYGCVEHDGALCLVMKLYPRSLHVFLDARRSPDGQNYVKPLSNVEVVGFTQQILQGLTQLHAEGIVVQDLKPANLLMDERDQVVISDFGLAAVLSSTMASAQTSMHPGGGTPAYMAPEQYDPEGFGRVSEKTDLWALGCVVVELVTGFAPWRGKQQPEIMMNVAMKQKAPPMPAGVDGALEELLQTCFNHEQWERPTAQHALESLRATSSCESML